MKRTQQITSYLALLSEVSHVFCCVLPSVFSVLTMLVGLGILGAVPVGMVQFHDFMHGWEMPIMVTSGGILLLGWALHIISEKLDCRSTGCAHEPCTPKKKKTSRILKIATVLFVVNVAIYVSVHMPHDVSKQEQGVHAHHDDHHHH